MSMRIAIVGGGIAGLTAAYLLNEKHDITLFEATHRLGGNAYTHDTRDGEAIDIAVASYSKRVSTEFLKLLSRLKVPAVRRPANAFLSILDMDTEEALYMTPLSLRGLIAQRFAFFSPETRRHLLHVLLGMNQAMALLDEGKLAGLSVEDTIKMLPTKVEGFAAIIMLAPLCLLSSMYYEEVMKGPAEFFIKKLKVFGGFSPTNQTLGLHFPKELTRSYVEALASHYRDKVVLNSRIAYVSRNEDKVILKMEDGQEAIFDKVVFACNADQALELLEKPTDEEARILGPWKYKEGLMVVHKDPSSFPRRELCQSWTCLVSRTEDIPHMSISCCCWRLSPAVSRKSEYLSTQHLNFPVREDLLDFQKIFRTPIFDFDSFPTIEDLPSLNGKMNSYYCGSHFGLGLHNDAVRSAIEVAKHLGAEWE